MESYTPKCPVCGTYLDVDDIFDRDYDDPQIIEEGWAYCPICAEKNKNFPYYKIKRVFTCSKAEILETEK